jgi:molecular chaperone GrpE
MSAPEESSTGPVIRDLRRIDPETGQVRAAGPGRQGAAGDGSKDPQPPGAASQNQSGAGAGGQAAAGGRRETSGPQPGGDAELAGRLAERTADLQRVTAEYANYRKRVERDRLAVREQALANVLYALLPGLDDIGRAREHGELVGGFKSVAESLESAVSKLGLTSFGETGDAFDPKVHEALTHSYSPEVTEPTCVAVMQPGYRVGERILRPARVAVAEPGGPAGEGPQEAGTAPEAGAAQASPGAGAGPGAGGSGAGAAGKSAAEAQENRGDEQ